MHMRDTTYSPNDYKDFPAGTPHAQFLTLIFGELILQSVFIGHRGRVTISAYQRPEGDPFTVIAWPMGGDSISWPPAMTSIRRAGKRSEAFRLSLSDTHPL